MVKSVPSTRWEELQQTVSYHVRMASVTRDATIFRLLNDPGAFYGKQFFSVAIDNNPDDTSIANDVRECLDTIHKVRPGGVTPLSKHIQEIREEVTNMIPTLSRTGKKVTVIVATDGSKYHTLIRQN